MSCSGCSVRLRLWLSAVQSEQLQRSARRAPHSCGCGSVFEPATRTESKPPSEKAARAFLLLPFGTAMREFSGLLWSLCAHRNEVSARVFAPLTAQTRETRPVHFHLQHLHLKKKKKFSCRPQTGHRVTTGCKMDNTAANSEKSHLIDEKNAKTYSLKLQRWGNVLLYVTRGE